MADLTEATVAASAGALGLRMAGDELAEVTHRLNALLDALAPLADLALGDVEPVPILGDVFTDPGASGAGAGETRQVEAAGAGPPRDAAPRAPSPGPAPTPASTVEASLRGDDLAFASATVLGALVRDKQVSPVDLVRLYLERIDRLDGRLRSYITVCGEAAMAAARAAETALGRGEPGGPLHGIPFAVKDQFATAGVRTTVGSRLLADHVPAETATVVERLLHAGGILLGKLNLTEFALGGTIEFPFGQPRNPWNLDHDPGGSSSGSGIATAAGLCAVSLGEDTGGSVRSPAAFCGVVGLRPTWGRVSRHGSFPLAWSMDAAGPLGRTVEDVARLFALIAGHDPRDPLMSHRSVPDGVGALDAGVRGLRIGVIRDLTASAETAEEVRAAVTAAARAFEREGAIVDEVSLPLLPLAGAVFMALADSDGAGLHLRWLRTRPGDYDRGTRRRLLTAALVPAATYHEAARARALIRRQVLDALARRDLLLCPVAPQPPGPIAALAAPITARAQVAGRFFARRSYVTPAALAGVPAIAVPAGPSASGLPLAVQLLGRPFDEPTLLRAARAHERATPPAGRPPGT
jgi:aspartyl-tRNA(Asn)/glutamyl-tRNA(Gln) amidotransferase subunit A